ncbi:hypothetical protein TNCT_480451 [Trichonephila clavata]|uniref:Uncharacterized protein n=1 Tax=Trichonephila clavata TaxID=2740835 RepID=A0A8X6LG88_TRICU|nr:hypothetical protein TNCT_480451 [Trichonephila clavata]
MELMKISIVMNYNKAVPEYQIVQLRSISKRDTSSEDVKQIHVPAFGKKVAVKFAEKCRLRESYWKDEGVNG